VQGNSRNSDAGPSADGGLDAPILPGDEADGSFNDASVQYHDMTSSAYWLTYDLGAVSATAKGYQGAAFDGRYVYLAPFTHGTKYDGLTTRYDTQMSFDGSTSWTTFDTASVTPGAQGFSGAVFDGRYIYLVPNNNGSPM